MLRSLDDFGNAEVYAFAMLAVKQAGAIHSSSATRTLLRSAQIMVGKPR